MVPRFCNHGTWGAEIEGAGIPDRPGLHRETLSQNPSARAAVSGRVLMELAQVEFLHQSKRGGKN